jgi:hypothetical protein
VKALSGLRIGSTESAPCTCGHTASQAPSAQSDGSLRAASPVAVKSARMVMREVPLRILVRRVVFSNRGPLLVRQEGAPSSPRFIRAHLFGQASAFCSCHF